MSATLIPDYLTVDQMRQVMRLHRELEADQEHRIEAGEDVNHLPLIWVALAEFAGLSVDVDGRIVDGPKRRVAGIVTTHKTQ